MGCPFSKFGVIFCRMKIVDCDCGFAHGFGDGVAGDESGVAARVLIDGEWDVVACADEGDESLGNPQEAVYAGACGVGCSAV